MIIGRGVDAGGHLLRYGKLPNGTPVVQEQDIWKYNPKDYKDKWLKAPDSKVKDKIKNKLLQLGLREVDILGTPVITRTPVYK